RRDAESAGEGREEPLSGRLDGGAVLALEGGGERADRLPERRRAREPEARDRVALPVDAPVGGGQAVVVGEAHPRCAPSLLSRAGGERCSSPGPPLGSGPPPSFALLSTSGAR